MGISLFTSFNGRIGRADFWLGSLATLVAIAVPYFIFVAVAITNSSDPDVSVQLSGEEIIDNYVSDLSPVAGIAVLIALIAFTIAFAWATFVLQVKRWHDRNKSAWWVLINFVPFIGGIWALVENGFLRGTDGPNDYGPDPLADSSRYRG